MRIELERVHYMPSQLRPGLLYASEEFGIAIHLCACGCGEKVSTPLGPTEWALTETDGAPTLRPSVGGWQQACRSHYLITRGEVEWADQWSDEQILEGRCREEERRNAYFQALYRRNGLLNRLRRWFTSLFRR